MPFNPDEPVDVAVWRSVQERAHTNLTRELAAVADLVVAIQRDLFNSGHVLTSDARRLTAMTAELSRYAAELAALDEVTPEAARPVFPVAPEAGR